MLRHLLPALLAALVFLPIAHTQSGELISPDELRSDFANLHETLEAAHFDLYAHTPRSVFDQRRAEIHAELSSPLSRRDAAVLFQTYVALARHGHARIDFPFDTWFDWVGNGGVILPIDVRIREGQVWLADHQSASDALSVGDEILSLNGIPNAVWLARYTRHLSADTPHMAYTLLETYLPLIFWVENPEATVIELEVRNGAGQIVTLSLPLLDLDEIRAARSQANPFVLPEYDARMLDGDIAYLRPGAFSNSTPAESPWDPTRYIARVDEALTHFINADARALIIDIRDNPGGDTSFSDPIIAWFADRPWRFASRFRVRVSDATTASNAARLSEGANAISRRYAELFAHAEDGDIVDFELDMEQPRDGQQFQGDVYVLVNRYSYSNATTMAALIQDYGFATIAGEMTADMATTYGALERYTLPNTGLVLGYPKAHIIRPNGEDHPHPVTPDLELDFPVLRGETDVVLEQLRALISERSQD